MIKIGMDFSNLDLSKYTTEIQEYIIDHKKEIAHRVKDRAKQLCPKKTGRLCRSIRVRKTRDGFEVRANAPHAHLVEFGHRIKKENGEYDGHVPPHPFLRPARDEVLNNLLNSGAKGFEFAESAGVFDDYWKG